MNIDPISLTRMLEDGTGTVLILFAMVWLFRAGLASPAHRFVTLSLAVGLVPLWIWKTMGFVKRAFVDKAASADLYALLNHTGEVFETFSGLTLAIVVGMVSIWTLGD